MTIETNKVEVLGKFALSSEFQDFDKEYKEEGKEVYMFSKPKIHRVKLLFMVKQLFQEPTKCLLKEKT